MKNILHYIAIFTHKPSYLAHTNQLFQSHRSFKQIPFYLAHWWIFFFSFCSLSDLSKTPFLISLPPIFPSE